MHLNTKYLTVGCRSRRQYDGVYKLYARIIFFKFMSLFIFHFHGAIVVNGVNIHHCMVKNCILYNRAKQYRLAHFRNVAPTSLNFRDPHYGLFRGLRLLLGYLATSNAKYDVRFLLGDPDFLSGRRNFAPISTDRKTRRPKQNALTL